MLKLKHTSSIFLALLPLAYLLYYIYWQHFRLPLWQHLDMIFVLKEWTNDRLIISDFFEPVDGSFQTIPHIIRLILMQLSDWQTVFECILSAIFAFSNALLLTDNKKRYLMMPLAVLWYLALDQASNWVWGWQFHLYLSAFASVATICILTKNNINKWQQILALFCAFIASHSYLSGLLMFPIGLILVWRGSKLWRNIWLIITAFMAWRFYGVILPNFQFGTGDSSITLTIHRVFNQLGSTIYNLNYWIAIYLGIVIFITIIACFVFPRIKPSRKISWLIIYAMLASIIFAIHRIGIQDTQAAIARSLVFSNIVILALFIHAFRHPMFDTGSRATKMIPCFIIILLLIPKLYSSYHVGDYIRFVSRGYEQLYHHMRGAYPTIDESGLVAIHQSNNADVGRHAIWLLHKYEMNLYRK